MDGIANAMNLQDATHLTAVYQAVTATVAEGIVVVDHNGVIQAFNVAAERIFGYTAEEIVGKKVDLLIPLPTRAHHDAYLNDAESGLTRRNLGKQRQLEALRKDGSYVAVEIVVSEFLIDSRRWYTGAIRDVSEREQLRAEAAEARRRTKIATSAAGVGVWEWTLEADTIVCDHQFERLYGLKEGKFGGRFSDWISLVHPEDRQRCCAALELAIAQDVQFSATFRTCLSDGGIRHIQAAGAVERLSDGTAVSVIGTNWDVTDLSIAQQSLQAQSDAIDAALLYMELDARGKIVRANSNFLAVLRYSADQLIGEYHDLLVSEGTWAGRSKQRFWDELVEGHHQRLTVCLRNRDGENVWIEGAYTPVKDIRGALQNVLILGIDVTESHEATRLLAEHHRNLEASSRIDRISVRLMHAFNTETVSTPADEILQAIADEAGYRPLAYYAFDEWKSELVAQAQLGLSADYAKQAGASDGFAMEVARRRKPIFLKDSDGQLEIDTGIGKVAAAAVFGYPVVHRDRLLGVLAGASRRPIPEVESRWLGQVVDQIAIGLNAHHQYEELKTLSAELNARSQRIVRQNEALERASQHKSDFLARMSHELRTPLNAIIGFSEVLKDGLMGVLQPGQNDYVREIHVAGRHLLDLISDILDLSKVESGKMNLELSAVDLKAVINSVLALNRRDAVEKNIRIQTVVPIAMNPIQADERKLRQIICNLVSNAVKFTVAGSVTVEVLDRGDRVEVSVMDTGIGISAADLERLFAPFEQLDGGLSRRFEGTGLGLAIAKSLVELHGGTLSVDSTVDVGSRFYFSLPRRHPSTTASDTPDVGVDHQGSTARTSKPDKRESRRVLVVVEDLSTRTWVSDALSLRYAVDQAATRSEAASALARQRYDAIVKDIFMAHDAFKEPSPQTLSASHLDATPVVMVSLDPADGRGIALGAAAVIQKSMVSRDLPDAVVSVLPRAPANEDTRILVVDDDPRAVHFVSKGLENAGYAVLRAFSGSEALEFCHTEAIHAVVLDLIMPEVSGLEVLRELRGIDTTAKIPVILLTARDLTSPERRQLAMVVDRLGSKHRCGALDLVQEVERVTAISASSLRHT